MKNRVKWLKKSYVELRDKLKIYENFQPKENLSTIISPTPGPDFESRKSDIAFDNEINEIVPIVTPK